VVGWGPGHFKPGGRREVATVVQRSQPDMSFSRFFLFLSFLLLFYYILLEGGQSSESDSSIPFINVQKKKKQ
jgi:hypothetical protein